MRTWEMIKALTEDSKLKFKNMRMSGIIGLNENGELVWLTCVSANNRLFTIAHSPDDIRAQGNLKDEWKPVKEPVDFMTAYKAWSDSNKTIICKMMANDGKRYLFEKIFNGTDNDANFGAGLIGAGVWYIEE